MERKIRGRRHGSRRRLGLSHPSGISFISKTWRRHRGHGFAHGAPRSETGCGLASFRLGRGNGLRGSPTSRGTPAPRTRPRPGRWRRVRLLERRRRRQGGGEAAVARRRFRGGGDDVAAAGHRPGDSRRRFTIKKLVWFIPLADERGVCSVRSLENVCHTSAPYRPTCVHDKALYKSTFTLPYLIF